MSSWRTMDTESPPPVASAHARTIQSTIWSTASRHVLAPANSSGASAGSTNVLPSSPRRVRAGSIGSALNAAKLVVPAALPSTTGDGGGGAVLESRRERRERVGVRERSGGGRRFTDDDDEGGGETGTTTTAVRCLGVVVDVRFGDALGRVGERGLDTVGEELLLLLRPVNLLVVGVAGVTMCSPVGEAGISTLLRTE